MDIANLCDRLIRLAFPAFWFHHFVNVEPPCRTCVMSLAKYKLLCGDELTRVSLPIEIITGITVTLMIQPELIARRAVCKGYMVVSDIIEEMNFFLLEREGCGN